MTNHPPVVHFFILDPQGREISRIEKGSNVTFDARSTSDPDGDPVTISWTLLHQGRVQDVLSGPRVPYIVAQPGFFTVRVEATDSKGLGSSLEKTLAVDPLFEREGNVTWDLVVTPQSKFVNFTFDPGPDPSFINISLNFSEGMSARVNVTDRSGNVLASSSSNRTNLTLRIEGSLAVGDLKIEITFTHSPSSVGPLPLPEQSFRGSYSLRVRSWQGSFPS